MRARPIHRLGTWLCFAAALVMGLAPAQALVFCFGPEGTIALEVSLDSGPCGGCPEIGAEERESGVVATGGSTGCPCIDIVVGQPEGAVKAKPKPFELALHALAAVPIAQTVTPNLCADIRFARRAARGPDVAPVLALIRNTVLLV